MRKGDAELLTWLIMYGKERVEVDDEAKTGDLITLTGMGYVDWVGHKKGVGIFSYQITSTGLHRLNQLEKQSKQNQTKGEVK